MEPSIGSGGGIAAARDGAVDLGLVSRPLRPEEAADLERVDLARDAVVLAAAADVAVDDLSSDDLHRLYRGELRGLTVLLRDEAESANAALESVHPGLADDRRRSAASGRFRVLDHDDAMALALATTPRAVGVFSLGALRPPLRALRIDGVGPLRRGGGPGHLACGADPRSRLPARAARPGRSVPRPGDLRAWPGADPLARIPPPGARAVIPVALTRPFARRLLPLVLVAGSLFAVVVPLAHHLDARSRLVLAARERGERVARILAEAVRDRPLLWRYDAAKLAGRLQLEGLLGSAAGGPGPGQPRRCRSAGPPRRRSPGHRCRWSSRASRWPRSGPARR